MQIDQDFYVIQNVKTGQILTETKASGKPRPALYASPEAANRAMGQRDEVQYEWKDNPDYDPSIKINEVWRSSGLGHQQRQELLHKAQRRLRVDAAPGTWQIVKVKITPQ